MSILFNDATSDGLTTAWSTITGVPFSMAAWCYIDDAGAVDTNIALMSIADKDANKYYCLFADMTATFGGAPSAYVYPDDGGDHEAAATYDPTNGNWYHVCGVWATLTDRRCYANGGNKGTNASTEDGVSNIDQLSIGVSADSTPNFWFSGYIAEAAIWNVALTDADVAILGKGYSPKLVKPQNLVEYWPLVREIPFF